MSLRAKLRGRISSGSYTAKGFDLQKPTLQHFRGADGFVTAIQEQAEATALVDADPVKRLDLDGYVEGTDWRLSHAAFSDMCHFTKTPVSFLKRLARYDENLALDVVQSVLENAFHNGHAKCLVVDSRTGLVEGIVGKDTYSPIPNIDVFSFAMSATHGLEMTNGWLAGPTMRLTATVKDRPVQPRKGDIVNFGMSVENSIHGDSSCVVMDYLERLVCTNGMTARDAGHMSRIRHTGDVTYNVQNAVVKASYRAEQIAPLLQKSAHMFLDDQDIRAVRAYIRDGKNGGNKALDVKVVKSAVREAVIEGRSEEEVTLFNFVNGVTEAAHDSKSLDRKVEIEALGYRTLAKFGVQLAMN